MVVDQEDAGPLVLTVDAKSRIRVWGMRIHPRQLRVERWWCVSKWSPVIMNLL